MPANRAVVPPFEVGDPVFLFWPNIRFANITEIAGKLATVTFLDTVDNGDVAGTTVSVKLAKLSYNPSPADIKRRAAYVRSQWTREERWQRQGHTSAGPDPYAIPTGCHVRNLDNRVIKTNSALT